MISPNQESLRIKLTLLPGLAALALGLSLSTASAEEYLRDDFEFYPIGSLINGSQWPAAVPGTAMRWSAAPQGSLSIVNGNSTGRSGQLYHYSVGHMASAPDNRAFSTVRLNPILSAAESWSLTLDFFVESLPTDGGQFGLVTLFNSANATAAYRLGGVSFHPQSDGSIHVLMGMGSRYENPLAKTFEVGFIDVGKWYTLTITGNNENRTLMSSLAGDGYHSSSDQGFYASTLADRLQQIALGAFSEGPSGNLLSAGQSKSVYVDNIQVQTIPEPASIAFVLGGMGVLALTRHVKGLSCGNDRRD